MALAEEHREEPWIPVDAFGGRLMLIRGERGWNISQAAEACGIDSETWRGWENGRNPRNYEATCRKIADATGCSYDWLAAGGVLARSRWFSVPLPPGQLELALGAAEPELALVR